MANENPAGIIENPQALDQALGKILKHLRDVSLRDGIQSWDGNLWRIDDILTVTTQLNAFAKTVNEKLGITLPPVEAWGGAQVAVPAKTLKQDPLVNLDKIHAHAPDLILQCLYRGRQGFGYIPISDEVQKEGLISAVKHGIKVFRIFDMMNDIRNVSTGISVLKEYKEAHPDSGVIIEGAISYISEPPPADRRAWTLDEYADYAVKLAKAGCDEIAIKDYAGVGDKELPQLIEAIRTKLEIAGYKGMNINVHSHGEKPELIADIISHEDANPDDKVDVAIGDLSNGPSHTNMRTVIETALKRQGFSQEAISAHPVMQELAKVEASIKTVVERKTEASEEKIPGKPPVGKSFDDVRGPLKKLKRKDIERFRVAAGGLSELWKSARSQFPKNTPEDNEHAEKFFHAALEESIGLWEKAGRFNTVTPGALILTTQAIAKVMRDPKVMGERALKTPFLMKDYTANYVNIAIGRFGDNQGMDKGIGNTAWRDAMLMYRAFEVLNTAIRNDTAKSVVVPRHDIKTPNTDPKGSAGNVNIPPRNDIITSSQLGGPGLRVTLESDGTIKLNDPSLERILTYQDPKFTATPLERFKATVEKSSLPKEVKDHMLEELKIGRSQSPTEGLEEGHKILNQFLESKDLTLEDIKQKKGVLSSPDDLAIEAMLLRNRASNGKTDDSTFENLLAANLGVTLYASSVKESNPSAVRGASK